MNVRVGMETVQLKNAQDSAAMTLELPNGAVVHGMERIGSFLYIYWSNEVTDEVSDEFEVGSP